MVKQQSDTNNVFVCRQHVYTENSTCPVCGNPTEQLLTEEQRLQLSKFLSGLLRHFPNEYGLTVDNAGWADKDTVVNIITDKYEFGSSDALHAVVSLGKKDRFELNPRRIRATYGHSIDVTINGDSVDPDDTPVLYHGTSPTAAESIKEDGLQPMSRQSVYLSPDIDEALIVGNRHTDPSEDPVVFIVDVAGLTDDGITVHQRGSTVYAAPNVPPEHLDLLPDP